MLAASSAVLSPGRNAIKSAFRYLVGSGRVDDAVESPFTELSFLNDALEPEALHKLSLASSPRDDGDVRIVSMPFACWGDVVDDRSIASAMIDWIVHHADVISLKGASYRLKRSQPADTAQ